MHSRTEQLASVIRAAVQEVLARGLNDPRVRGLISVTKVELTPDLSEARVHVSILPAEHSTLTMHGLSHAAKHVQSQVSKAVAMRRAPRISFHLDASLKKEAEVYAAIARSRGDHDEEPLPAENQKDLHE